jgi:hypothetical protein
MENNTHWISKVACIEATNLAELIESLNKFYEDKFIIATQVWSPVESGVQMWEAIVYFKVSPM